MVTIAKQNQETFGRRVNPYGSAGPAGVPEGVIWRWSFWVGEGRLDIPAKAPFYLVARW